MVLRYKIEFYKNYGMVYTAVRKEKRCRSMKNTNWYRKYKLTLFSIFLAFFLIADIYFEIRGEMFESARIIFAGMIIVSAYGIIKYSRCKEKISAIAKREKWIMGAHSGVLHS